MVRLTNQIINSKSIGRWSSFDGITEGRTYTATADEQLLRLWGNNVLVMPSSGMYTALVSDMAGIIKPAADTVFLDGVASCPATKDWWRQGLTMKTGAKLTIQCVGYFTDADWQVMQALGVVCFVRNTAAY